MTPASPRYLAAATSHQGFVRGNNEDRIYHDDIRGYFAVIDGVGGHEAGEHAAEMAVERIRLRLERQTGTMEQRLREAITMANNAIFEAARTKPEWHGMACVLTVAAIENGNVTVGHVGDSRLYRIKRGKIEKITHDHSPVGEREDSGELTEAEAMQHPRRNEVYRDVGSEQHTPSDDDFIEIQRMPFEPDGALLLCSDGLSDAISSKQILQIVEANAGDRWGAVDALVNAAIQTGKDNVSVVLVEGDRFAQSFGRAGAPPSRTIRLTGAPDNEITDRLPIRQKSAPPIVPDPESRRADPVRNATRPPKSTVWRSVAWFLLGLLLAAGAMYGIQQYLKPPPVPPGPRIVQVKNTESIAAALTKAQAGDTIHVDPGTYSETLQLRSGVTVVAVPAYDAIIVGVVSAENVHNARFEGFRVRTGGIRIKDSNVVLVRDDVSEAGEAGIDFAGSSRGAILACSIYNNNGGGIVVEDSSAPAIEHNLITSNGVRPPGRQAGPARPGLLLATTSQPRVSWNVFIGNGAEAIWLPQPDNQMIERNYFNVTGKPDRKPKFKIEPLKGRP